MTETQTVEQKGPDVAPDCDSYYGHLSNNQLARIRRAVKDGADIDEQAAHYGVDRMFIERAVAADRPKRKYRPRKKKVEKHDGLDIPPITDEELMSSAGVDQVYSTNDVGDFFDRSNQWLYWGLRQEDGKPPVFTYEDGSPIVPERVGDPELGRRRFTLPIIKAILMSSYRRGNIDPDELKKILRRIRIAELGGNWKAREGWTQRVITNSRMR